MAFLGALIMTVGFGGILVLLGLIVSERDEIERSRRHGG